MRTDEALRRRLTLAALLAGLWIALAVTGFAREATRTGALTLLHATGFGTARPAAADLFVVGSQPYRISFGCTPVGISLCLLALLACSRLAPRPFFASAVAITAVSGPLMITNTVVSVHLHQSGIPWLWAHYPGSVAVYALLLWGTWALARGGGGDDLNRKESKTMTMTRVRGATLALLGLALAFGFAAPGRCQTPPASQTLQIGEWKTILVPSGVFYRRPVGTGPITGIEILWGGVSASDSKLRFLYYTGTDALAGLEALAPIVPLSASEKSYIKLQLSLTSTTPKSQVRTALGSWNDLTEDGAKDLATQDLGVDIDPTIVSWGLGFLIDGDKEAAVKTSDCTYKAEVRFLATVYGGSSSVPSALRVFAVQAKTAAASCVLASQRPTGVPPAPAPATPPPVPTPLPPGCPSGPTVWAYDSCTDTGATSACVTPNWTYCTCQCNSAGVWQPNCGATPTPVPAVTPGAACTTPGVYQTCGTGVCSCSANAAPPPANIWTVVPPPPPPATGSLEVLALAALAALALGIRSLRRA